jgi:phosphatidylglycerophosphate synthase
MAADRLGEALSAARDRLARLISRAGITPNTLTFSGMLLSVAVAVLFAQGRFRWGGVVMLFSNACDLLDGAVARTGRMKTRLGTFLDSSLDRYSDALALTGIIIHYAIRDDLWLLGAGVSALVGSMLVSYMRARAETLIPSCSVGFWTRGERCLLLMCAALVNRVAAAVCLLAVLTHLTVLQRILHTHWVLNYGHPMFHPPEAHASSPDLEPPPPSRLKKVGLALARFVFWDYQRDSVAYDIALFLIVAFVILAPLR